MLKTKLENQLKKEFEKQGKNKEDYEIALSNISINGKKVGCSGFVCNKKNNCIVYVNTEKSIYGPISNKNLVRYAREMGDYKGGYNTFVSDGELAKVICKMLENNERWKDEFSVYDR